MGIPMGTNCDPLSLLQICLCFGKKEIMFSLWNEHQADVEAFNSTSWYLDDLPNIDNKYFD